MELQLLRKKHELLTQVYDMTRAAVFSGDENDVNVYIDLMENREKLFDQIKILDDKMTDTDPGTEARSVISEIKKTTADIIGLDKDNEAKASRIMADLKKSLKGINENKNINIKYNDFIPTNDGMYFDKKN